jgi:MMP endo-(1,4)-3-O-methyl-alpha-D-mannosidase
MRSAKPAPRGRPAPPAEILRTAGSIAAVQRPSGAIPWPDGHVDPWDHVECAMALSACGLIVPARLAYQWLRETQRADGSWPRTTGGPEASSADAVADHAAESHHAAYVAVGTWHEYLVTGDRRFVERMWPTVKAAIGWVLALQAPRGEVAWERDAAGASGRFALLSGCSSILQALRCAITIAGLVADPQPDWELAADQLCHAINCHPEAFADKTRFSMDWYYPVLGGALHGRAAAMRIADGWDTFVADGLGVRCVRDQPWVTVAETCELVISLEAIGQRDRATAVLATVERLRHEDGSYWTGWQYVNNNHFPAERSSWTSAAVVLAADALAGFSGGAGIFRDIPARFTSRPSADLDLCGCVSAETSA